MKINEGKLQKVVGFDPHPAQKEILECKNREILVCAGRRFGKSVLAAYLALKELLQPKKRVWLVAPNYDLSQIVFDITLQWLLKIATSGKTVEVKKRPFPTITTAFGSILECKSVENPVGLLGRATDLIIMDEAARIPEDIWNVYLFPTTHDKRGKVVFISTPLGQNWFYHKFIQLKEEGSAFQFPSNANPYFPKEEWERAQKFLPERVFLQEYMASFLPEAASIFRGVDEIINENALEDPKPGHFYIMGVDLAKYRDFTVLVVIDKVTNKVVAFDRFKEINYPLQKMRIVALAKRYNNAKVIIDSTGVGDPIVDDLKNEGLWIEDFKIEGKSKTQLIDKLSIFIEQKAIIIPPIEALINELKVFSCEMTRAGNIIYTAPQGYHDDCVFALALAVWGLTSTNPSLQQRSPIKPFKRKFEYA